MRPIVEREFPLWSPGSGRKMLHNMHLQLPAPYPQSKWHLMIAVCMRDIEELMSKIRCRGNISILWFFFLFFIYIFIICGRMKQISKKRISCVIYTTMCIQQLYVSGNVNMSVFGNTAALFVHNRMNRWCLKLQLLVYHRDKMNKIKIPPGGLREMTHEY